MPSTYKKNTPLDERKQKSAKMLSMYPNRIPVIVEMSTSSASYTSYQSAEHKIKYLVPYDISMGQFIKIIRDKLKSSIEVILKGSQADLHSYIEKFREEFNQMPVEDIAFPRGVNG